MKHKTNGPQFLSLRRFRFQNPLHQNYRHLEALSALLGIARDSIFSVIMFWGDCELRTEMPSNVLTNGYTDYIKSKRLVLFDDADVKRTLP